MNSRRKHLKLKSPEDVRRSLTRISNMLINEEIDPKVANSLISCCNAVLSSLRTDEQEKKLEYLEDIIRENNLM